MRIIYPSVARNAYYDRNPTVSSLSYGASGITPHNFTIRATYTVPANRKAILQAVFINVYRSVVAGTVGLVYGVLRVHIGGTPRIMAQLQYVDNTLNVFRNFTIPAQIHLGAGDEISLGTIDQSTGGTNEYSMQAIIMEYDA